MRLPWAGGKLPWVSRRGGPDPHLPLFQRNMAPVAELRMRQLMPVKLLASNERPWKVQATVSPGWIAASCVVPTGGLTPLIELIACWTIVGLPAEHLA